MSRLEVQRVIQRIEEVPALSHVYEKASAMIASETSNAKDIARLIESDVSMTTRILKVANSAALRRSNPVESVSQAVVTLGFENVQTLILGASTIAAMGEFMTEQTHWLWRHAYAAGSGAKFLAEKLPVGAPENAFVAGLIQNFGQIIVFNHFKEQYQEVMKRLSSESDILQAESEVLGITHCEVGYMLARRWRLPEMVVNIVRFHHEPEKAGEFRLHAVVAHIADTIATGLGLGSAGDDHVRRPHIEDLTWSELYLGQDALVSICARTLAAVTDFEDFFDLDSSTAAHPA